MGHPSNERGTRKHKCSTRKQLQFLALEFQLTSSTVLNCNLPYQNDVLPRLLKGSQLQSFIFKELLVIIISSRYL